MNEPYPPASPYQQPPPARSGMGCFAKGCLVVIVVLMIVGVMVGGFGYYVYKNSSEYLSQQPEAIRVYPATDEQYNAVLAKLQPFGQALNDGRAATLKLSADELNTLIAKLPESNSPDNAPYAKAVVSPALAATLSGLPTLRGHAYISFVDNQVVSDLSVPLSDRPSAKGGTLYLNGRVTMDASYSADEFSFVLRKVAPLKGESNGFISRFTNNPEFLRGFSRSFTDSFNRSFDDKLSKSSGGVAPKERIRTIVLENNEIVFTSADTAPATPTETPAETPAETPGV